MLDFLKAKAQPSPLYWVSEIGGLAIAGFGHKGSFQPVGTRFNSQATLPPRWLLGKDAIGDCKGGRIALYEVYIF